MSLGTRHFYTRAEPSSPSSERVEQCDVENSPVYVDSDLQSDIGSDFEAIWSSGNGEALGHFEAFGRRGRVGGREERPKIRYLQTL